MDSEEPELNPAMAETDSEKTNESVQISRPAFAVDKRPPIPKKLADRLKEVQP